MNEYSLTVSFWDLLKTKKIVIPIIQRDYAQGRKGKEFLRERFLKQLFDALNPDAKPLVLDFVYGSTEDGIFYPLDGQQRLTTLWLLHWYLALCAGTLSEDGRVLENFSYETRISSRTFCHKLCSIRELYQPEKSGIADFVRNQSWFYSAYEQDPTIQSMLRMLGGTDIKDHDGIDITDGIEEYYRKMDPTKEKAQELLEQLKRNSSPVSFYLLNMEDKNMPLTDDLYIKMNARGKQLTSFENFKADLLKCKLSDRDSLIPENDNFSQLLDTTWTDLFWPYRSKYHHIDEIYMSFLNRFFLNWYIATSPETVEKVEANDFYKWLSEGESKEGTEYRYQSLSIYKPVLTRDCIESLRTCLNRLSELYQTAKEKVETLFNPYWEENTDNNEAQFCFIPKYKTGENAPVKINLKQQVVFHAICVYLTTCSEINTDRLKDWMHFVWNIAENNNIDSSEQRIRAIRFFEKGLAALPKIENCETPDHASKDIIAYLAGIDGSRITNNMFGRDQLLEEIAKAKRMKGDDNWKEKIHAAEKYAFFKGAIRFLYRNDIGEENWNDFDKKWTMVQKFFKDSCSSKGSVMNDDFRNAELLKSLISNFSVDNFWKTLWWNHRTFNNRPESWMYYLLNDNICSPVHILLMNGVGIKPLAASKNFAENTLYLLSNTGLLDFVRNKIRDSWIRRWRSHGHYAIYPSGTGVFLDAEKRDKFLLETPGVTIKDDYKIDNTRLLYGSDINFEYHGKNFQWYRTDFIYLMEDKDPNDYKLKDKSKKEETEKYYCFNAKELDDSQIIKGLSSLLEIHT